MASRTAKRCNPIYDRIDDELGGGMAAMGKLYRQLSMSYPAPSAKNVTLCVVFRLNLERFHPIYALCGYIAVF
jgi:hypothetical protein